MRAYSHLTSPHSSSSPLIPRSEPHFSPKAATVEFSVFRNLCGLHLLAFVALYVSHVSQGHYHLLEVNVF